MPHEWNGLIVVKVEELKPFYNSLNSLYVEIQRYKNKPNGIKRVQLGGNGRHMLIDFDSLPPHIQHGLGDPRRVTHVLEPYYRTDNEAVVFFTKHQLPDGSYLSADYQDRYIINASVLKALISLRTDIEKDRKKKGQNNTGITAMLCEHAKNFQKTLKVRFNDEHTLPESEKRFKGVLKDFENAGYKTLISGKHGNANSRKVDDKTIGLLTSLFVSDSSKPNPTEVQRRYMDFLAGKKEIINNSTGEVYNPKDFPELTESTVRQYLTSWASSISTSHIRQGDNQKRMQLFKPPVTLKKLEFAGALISVDDRNPPFVMHNGKRIWLYVAVDVASEAYVCLVHGETKEGIIKEFYRQLVRNFAFWTGTMPDGLECESNLNSQFVNTFLERGAMFQNVRIEPNNARGKIIENFNGRMRYGIEKNEENFNSRPFAKKESNQAGTKKAEAMHYDDIVSLCVKNYEEWNDAPHSVHTHLSRWEVFVQMQHPDLKPINYHAILPYLGIKSPTSCNQGIIRFKGGQYLLGENDKVASGDRLINLMEKVEGKDVTVYWLDDNDGNVLKALVYIETLLICEAIPKPTFSRAVIERKPEDEEAMATMMAYINTIESYGRAGKKAIDKVTVIDNTPKQPGRFTMPNFKKNNSIINGWQNTEELPPLDDGIYFTPTKHEVKQGLKDRLNSKN